MYTSAVLYKLVFMSRQARRPASTVNYHVVAIPLRSMALKSHIFWWKMVSFVFRVQNLVWPLISDVTKFLHQTLVHEKFFYFLERLTWASKFSWNTSSPVLEEPGVDSECGMLVGLPLSALLRAVGYSVSPERCAGNKFCTVSSADGMLLLWGGNLFR